MKRIGILSSWASRANGGVFEAVVAHCALVRACGHEPVVFALDDEHGAADRSRFGETQAIVRPVVGPDFIGFSPSLTTALCHADLDLLHLHGIWMFPSRAAGNWAARTQRPYVVSPHGMLDPWITSRGTFKKLIAKHAYEYRSWRLASAFHALTAREADDIAVATSRHDATLIIPNAANVIDGKYHVEWRTPTLVYLGRIHPKKNIEGLVEAWRLARDILRPLGARLDIAGWGEPEHVAALKANLDTEQADDITFLGSVFGAEKAALIAGARFLALPSHSEGLPMSMLEAWSAGTPTLMSSECNLPEAFKAGAAIDCGIMPARIACALRQAFALSEPAWRTMSTAATTLIAHRFAQGVVAAQWGDAYANLMDGTPGGVA